MTIHQSDQSDAATNQVVDWTDLGREMWSFLTGREAAINYRFIDMSVEVPRDLVGKTWAEAQRILAATAGRRNGVRFALALTYLVAGWALVTGAFEIGAAIQLRKVITGEWLLLIAGLLSIVLAILVALFPGTGALLLVWWIGAYALAYGVVSLVLALRVRSWTRVNP